MELQVDGVCRTNVKKLLFDYKENNSQILFNRIVKVFTPFINKYLFKKYGIFKNDTYIAVNDYESYFNGCLMAIHEGINTYKFRVGKFAFEDYEKFKTYIEIKFCQENKISFSQYARLADDEKISKFISEQKPEVDIIDWINLNITNAIKNEYKSYANKQKTKNKHLEKGNLTVNKNDLSYQDKNYEKLMLKELITKVKEDNDHTTNEVLNMILTGYTHEEIKYNLNVTDINFYLEKMKKIVA